MERKTYADNKNKVLYPGFWQCGCVRSHDSRRKVLWDVYLREDKKKPHKIYQCPKCGREAIAKLLCPEQALNSSSVLG